VSAYLGLSYVWPISFIAIVIALIAGFSEIRRARDRRSSEFAYTARGQFVDICASAIEHARVAIELCESEAESKSPGSAFALLGEQLTRMNADIAASAISINGLERVADIGLLVSLRQAGAVLRDLRLKPMMHMTIADAVDILAQATSQLDENLEIVRGCHPAHRPSEWEQAMSRRNDKLGAPSPVWAIMPQLCSPPAIALA